MNIFNRTHNKLEELGFQTPNEIEEIESLGFVLYTNHHFNVLTKYYQNPTEEIIREESIKLRETLFYLNYNIWNAYLFVCVHEESSKDFTYIVEKDTKGLKKYVIKNFKDFDRIPIFDKYLNEKNFELETSHEGKYDEISNILELVKDKNGHEIKLTTEQVDTIIETVMKGLVN